MSTRVQKGGTVFKPIARPQRTRPGSEPRQNSTVPESQSSVVRTVSTHNEGTPAPVPASSTNMPPPARVPYKPLSNTSHPADSASRTTPVATPIRLNNRESNAESALSGASAIAIPARGTPRPITLSSQARTEVTRTPQPVLHGGGVAIAAPSRPVPVDAPRSDQPASHTVLVPSTARETDSARIPQQPLSLQASAVSSAHNGMPTSGPFDLSQIDPSLQRMSTTHHYQGTTVPLEGSSTMSTGGSPAVAPGESSRVPTNQDEDNTSSVLSRGVPQGKPKRRRTKRSQDAGSSPDSPPKKRRLRRSSSAQPSTEGEESQTTLGPKRRGKSRAPSVPPFDPDAGPGEDLDPTTVTMASLCDDTGQGRVSSKAAQVISNHAAWRAASKEKRARLRAIAEAKKYGRSLDDDEPVPAVNSGDVAGSSEANPAQEVPSVSRSPSAAPQAGPSSASAERSTQEGNAGGDDFDYSQDLSTSRYNVQVRIGANGETIIDEESLFVNRDEEDDTQNYTHVEESDTTKFVNSLTYSKKPRGSRWSAEETELFFDALSQFGENYELISLILPGRDRKACKNKFKVEDKKNPARINFCLNNRKPFDIQTLARLTGKDFSGPTPVIRAPTPIQSKELEPTTASQPEVSIAPKPIRKKSRTPAVRDGEEILGNIDDMDQDTIFGDEVNA